MVAPAFVLKLHCKLFNVLDSFILWENISELSITAFFFCHWFLAVLEAAVPVLSTMSLQLCFHRLGDVKGQGRAPRWLPSDTVALPSREDETVLLHDGQRVLSLESVNPLSASSFFPSLVPPTSHCDFLWLHNYQRILICNFLLLLCLLKNDRPSPSSYPQGYNNFGGGDLTHVAQSVCVYVWVCHTGALLRAFLRGDRHSEQTEGESG